MAVDIQQEHLLEGLYLIIDCLTTVDCLYTVDEGVGFSSKIYTQEMFQVSECPFISVIFDMRE